MSTELSNLDEVPTTAGVRERVFVALDALAVRARRDLEEDGASTIAWLGETIWVDRERRLALSSRYAERFVSNAERTLPQSATDELDAIAGRRHSSLTAWDVVRLLGTMLTNRGEATTAPAVFNYLIVQPMVNPAFKSLFWLGLSHELKRPHRPSDDLATTLGPMVYDMARYPKSRAEAADVRREQVGFVATIDPEIGGDEALALSDEDWAERCREVLSAQTRKLDSRVFVEVRSVVKGLVSGMV